jgi:small-conductance mechanosensitive channel/CRP-like cAMP-binding protein
LLQEGATLALGMLLIRQLGLALFRLIVPKLGMRPPRILEELLILLAYLCWILLRLSYAGLDPSSLLASTAVITAVLAFAMQDTLGNILSGLALQLDHSIHIGDWIQVDTINGEVMQVQWRHTAIRTLFGEMVLIPNSLLMKSQVMLTGGPSVPRRLRSVLFYGTMDVPPRVVIAEVQSTLAAAELRDIARDPAPTCVVLDFPNGLVGYAVRYWLTNPESPGTSDSLIRQHLYALYQRQGWRMAAPAREVRLERRPSGHEQNTAALEADRRFNMLSKQPLFAPLTDDERRRLAGQLYFVPYIAGSIIAHQNDVGDCMYILARGEVEVLFEANGRSERVAVLKPGEVMGEMSLMTGEPRRATLKALTDVDCYALDTKGFEATLVQRPELAESLAQLLTERSRALLELRNAMPRETATVQKAAILVRIRDIFGLSHGRWRD